MDIESIQNYCRSLPGTTEDIKWGHHPVFSVGDKMYAIIGLDHEPTPRISLKSSELDMAVLTQNEHIIPAPYLARHHWISLLRLDVFEATEIRRLIQESYRFVFAKLSKKRQRDIQP